MIQIIATLILLLLPPWSVIAQKTDWFASDGAAIKYSLITEESGLSSEWSLSIQTSPGSEHIIHYKNGKPITSWIRSRDSTGQLTSEAVEEDGRIREERLFNVEQQLILERFFLPDGSVEEIKYFHDDSRLISSTRFKNGTETGSKIYLYYSDGRLAGVREQTGNQHLATGMERPRSGQTSAWTNTPEGLILSFYDNTGRLVTCRTYRGAVLVSTEERIWGDGMLLSLSTELHETGTRVILNYDEAGLLKSRLESKDKDAVAYQEYGYDAADRLIFESRESGGRLETLEYVYNDDDSLASESRFINGLPSLSKVYTAPDEMLEEYYDKGKLFAKIWYKGGVKVREIIVSDGNIIRDRSF